MKSQRRIAAATATALLLAFSLGFHNARAASISGGPVSNPKCLAPCAAMLDQLNEYEGRKTVLLNAAAGYEEAVAKSIKREKLLLFERQLDNLDFVRFKNISPLCRELASILEEGNEKSRAARLTAFKERQLREYKARLARVRLEFRSVTACQDYASAYVHAVLDLTKEKADPNSIERRQYEQCIQLHSIGGAQ